jgi:hypothetical protein
MVCDEFRYGVVKEMTLHETSKTSALVVSSYR